MIIHSNIEKTPFTLEMKYREILAEKDKIIRSLDKQLRETQEELIKIRKAISILERMDKIGKELREDA